jgi:hypothetical protein
VRAGKQASGRPPEAAPTPAPAPKGARDARGLLARGQGAWETARVMLRAAIDF